MTTVYVFLVTAVLAAGAGILNQTGRRQDRYALRVWSAVVGVATVMGLTVYVLNGGPALILALFGALLAASYAFAPGKHVRPA